LHTRIRTVFIDGEPAYETKPAGSRKIIRAGRILNGNGDAVANGSILIDDKTIRAVGRDVSIPADAEESKFANAVVVPGFIDMGTHLGVGAPLSAPIAIGTKLADRLAHNDAGMKSARQGGLTTVLLTGTAPSSVLAFKLTDKPRGVKEPVALHFA